MIIDLENFTALDPFFSVPGYPRRVVGREASVVVLEYATHGRVTGTGRA
jgi:hypothetical protein